MADSTDDPRIVRVGVEINGQLRWYDERYYVSAKGTKYANANQDECEVKIANLEPAARNFLLTETSPLNDNRTPKRLIVEAGRKSYGTTRLFIGDIVKAEPSQPPDIILTLKAMTGQFNKGKLVSKNQPAQRKLSDIAKEVAGDLGATLDFQADDRSIANHAYQGSAAKQIDKLSELGPVNVYLDGNVLVVKNLNVPLNGKLRKLNLDSGMIGIPRVTETGINVTMLIDNQTTIGGALEIRSVINPAANGVYAIYKLGFDVNSRETPFYLTADAVRVKN